MSKITICEGNIKWTSKGNTVLHAFDGDISFSAGECNIWSGEQGNETGEYIAEAVGRQNEKFIACIDFYRSREHSEGKYGKLDTQYNGEFGFDRFDSKVCAEGLFSEYEKIRTVLTSENTYGKEKVYLCPYLSIWPPEIKVDGKTIKKKNEVTLFVKANKATDISKKNERATKATIVFSLEGENLKNEIVISPNKLDLEIGKEAKPISIKCNAPFEKDIKLIAKSVDEGQVLGQLIIKANAIIYTTTLQPVEIVFANINNNKVDNLPTTIDNRFFEKLVEYLNTKSLNQAYIHLTLASTIKKVTFSKQEFENKGLFYTKDGDTYLKMGANDHKDELNNNEKKDQSKASEYSILVENRYAARLNNLQNEQNQKERADKKKQNFINELKKYYKYERGDKLKRVHKCHSEKMVKTIWGKKDITALFEEWKKEEEAYLQMQSKISLDKKGKLHAFFTKDILTAGNPKRKTLAYSDIASGVSHIFKEAFINADEKAYATIAHELGHALGLEHTFSNELGIYIKGQEDDENEIGAEKNNIEQEIKNFEEIIKNIEEEKNFCRRKKIGKQGYLLLKELRSYYEIICKYIVFSTNPNLSVEIFEKTINDIINKEESEIVEEDVETLIISLENKKQNSEDRISEEKNKLKIVQAEKPKASTKTVEYPKYKEQSTTLENFMDYEQYENSIENNKNFLRKTFYQWQWKIMQEKGIKEVLKILTLLVLLLLSSCSIKKQYYAYESEQKDEEGRPLQYYTLEHQSGRRFKTNIIRFSDLKRNKIFVMIEAGEDYTFFAWSVDTSSTRIPYYETRTAAMFKQTIFEKLYSIDAKKAIFRYKNDVKFKDKIFNETADYLLKERFYTYYLWFPPEMKRVRRIDESKFPKGSVIKWK